MSCDNKLHTVAADCVCSAFSLLEVRTSLSAKIREIDVNTRTDNGRTFEGMTGKHMPPLPVVGRDI